MLFVTLFASFSVVAGCAARRTWVLAPGQHPQSFQRTARAASCCGAIRPIAALTPPSAMARTLMESA